MQKAPLEGGTGDGFARLAQADMEAVWHGGAVVGKTFRTAFVRGSFWLPAGPRRMADGG